MRDLSLSGFLSGIIRSHWNDTGKTNTAPAQGWHKPRSLNQVLKRDMDMQDLSRAAGHARRELLQVQLTYRHSDASRKLLQVKVTFRARGRRLSIMGVVGLAGQRQSPESFKLHENWLVTIGRSPFL